MATDECDCMNVCMYVIKNMKKNKQKEWHHATKHFMELAFIEELT